MSRNGALLVNQHLHASRAALDKWFGTLSEPEKRNGMAFIGVKLIPAGALFIACPAAHKFLSGEILRRGVESLSGEQEAREAAKE